MLAALGADVVDMESSAVAGAWESDTRPWRWSVPSQTHRGRELFFSPAGVAGALTALRAYGHRAERLRIGPLRRARRPTQTQTQIKRERFFWLRRIIEARRPQRAR